MSYTPLGNTPYDQYRERLAPYFGDGEFNRFTFPNNLSLSCIKCPASFGYGRDLFEIAVLDVKTEKFVTKKFFPYCSENVLGFLHEKDVLDALEKIANA